MSKTNNSLKLLIMLFVASSLLVTVNSTITCVAPVPVKDGSNNVININKQLKDGSNADVRCVTSCAANGKCVGSMSTAERDDANHIPVCVDCPGDKNTFNPKLNDLTFKVANVDFKDDDEYVIDTGCPIGTAAYNMACFAKCPPAAGTFLKGDKTGTDSTCVTVCAAGEIRDYRDSTEYKCQASGTACDALTIIDDESGTDVTSCRPTNFNIAALYKAAAGDTYYTEAKCVAAAGAKSPMFYIDGVVRMCLPSTADGIPDCAVFVPGSDTKAIFPSLATGATMPTLYLTATTANTGNFSCEACTLTDQMVAKNGGLSTTGTDYSNFVTLLNNADTLVCTTASAGQKCRNNDKLTADAAPFDMVQGSVTTCITAAECQASFKYAVDETNDKRCVDSCGGLTPALIAEINAELTTDTLDFSSLIRCKPKASLNADSTVFFTVTGTSDPAISAAIKYNGGTAIPNGTYALSNKFFATDGSKIDNAAILNIYFKKEEASGELTVVNSTECAPKTSYFVDENDRSCKNTTCSGKNEFPKIDRAGDVAVLLKCEVFTKMTETSLTASTLTTYLINYKAINASYGDIVVKVIGGTANGCYNVTGYFYDYNDGACKTFETCKTGGLKGIELREETGCLTGGGGAENCYLACPGAGCANKESLPNMWYIDANSFACLRQDITASPFDTTKYILVENDNTKIPTISDCTTTATERVIEIDSPVNLTILGVPTQFTSGKLCLKNYSTCFGYLEMDDTLKYCLSRTACINRNTTADLADYYSIQDTKCLPSCSDNLVVTPRSGASFVADPFWNNELICTSDPCTGLVFDKDNLVTTNAGTAFVVANTVVSTKKLCIQDTTYKCPAKLYKTLTNTICYADTDSCVASSDKTTTPKIVIKYNGDECVKKCPTGYVIDAGAVNGSAPFYKFAVPPACADNLGASDVLACDNTSKVVYNPSWFATPTGGALQYKFGDTTEEDINDNDFYCLADCTKITGSLILAAADYAGSNNSMCTSENACRDFSTGLIMYKKDTNCVKICKTADTDKVAEVPANGDIAVCKDQPAGYTYPTSMLNIANINVYSIKPEDDDFYTILGHTACASNTYPYERDTGKFYCFDKSYAFTYGLEHLSTTKVALKFHNDTFVTKCPAGTFVELNSTGTEASCVAECTSKIWETAAKKATFKTLDISAITDENYCVDSCTGSTYTKSGISQCVTDQECIDAAHADGYIGKKSGTKCVTSCYRESSNYAILASKIVNGANIATCGACGAGTDLIVSNGYLESVTGMNFDSKDVSGTFFSSKATDDYYCFTTATYAACETGDLQYAGFDSTNKQCITAADCKGMSTTVKIFKKDGDNCVDKCTGTKSATLPQVTAMSVVTAASTCPDAGTPNQTDLAECTDNSAVNGKIFVINSEIASKPLFMVYCKVPFNDTDEKYFLPLANYTETACPLEYLTFERAASQLDCLTEGQCFAKTNGAKLFKDKRDNVSSPTTRACVDTCYADADDPKLYATYVSGAAKNLPVCNTCQNHLDIISTPSDGTAALPTTLTYVSGPINITHNPITDPDQYCEQGANNDCTNGLKFTEANGSETCITDAECKAKSTATDIYKKLELPNNKGNCVKTCKVPAGNKCALYTADFALMVCSDTGAGKVTFEHTTSADLGLNLYNEATYTDSDLYCQTATTCPGDLAKESTSSTHCVTRDKCFKDTKTGDFYANNKGRARQVSSVWTCVDNCEAAEFASIVTEATKNTYIGCITDITGQKLFFSGEEKYHFTIKFPTATAVKIWSADTFAIATASDAMACVNTDMEITAHNICFNKTACLEATTAAWKSTATFFIEYYDSAVKEKCLADGTGYIALSTSDQHLVDEAVCLSKGGRFNNDDKCALTCSDNQIASFCVPTANCGAFQYLTAFDACKRESECPSYLSSGVFSLGACTAADSTACAKFSCNASKWKDSLYTDGTDFKTREKCHTDAKMTFDSFDATTFTTECVTKGVCVATKEGFLNNNECDSTCAFTTFTDLMEQTEGANTKVQKYCQNKTCSAQVTKDGATYCIDLTAHPQTGKYLEYNMALEPSSSLTEPVLNITDTYATTCGTGDNYKLIPATTNETGGLDYCLSLIACKSVNNPLNAQLFYSQAKKECRSDKHFYTEKWKNFSLDSKEVITFLECQQKGLFIDIYTQSCSSTCTNSILNYRDKVYQRDGNVDNVWLKLCVKDLTVQSNQTEFKLAVSSVLNYSTSAFNYIDFCRISNADAISEYFYYNKPPAESAPDYAIGHRLDQVLLRQTDNITTTPICNHNVVSYKKCMDKSGKVQINYSLARNKDALADCVQKCDYSQGFIDMTKDFGADSINYCIHREDCAMQGMVEYVENSSSAVKRSCVAFATHDAAITAETLQFVDGVVYNPNLCQSDDPSSALFFYEYKYGKFSCIRETMTLPTGFIISYSVGGTHKGFYETVVQEDCFNQADHGYEGKICYSLPLCKAKGKGISIVKNGAGQMTSATCVTECPTGYIKDLTGLCVEVCSDDQITKFASDKPESCLAVANPANNTGYPDSLKTVQLGSTTYVDYANQCGGGHLLRLRLNNEGVKRFDCVPTADCVPAKDSLNYQVTVAGGAQTICASKNYCFSLDNHGMKGNNCESALNQATHYLLDDGTNKTLVDEATCKGSNYILTSTDNSTIPNKCLTFDQCAAEATRIPFLNDKTCGLESACVAANSVKKEYYAPNTARCVSTCSTGFFKFYRTADDLDYCTDETTCKAEMNYYVSAPTKNCFEDLAKLRTTLAAVTGLVCDTVTKECSTSLTCSNILGTSQKTCFAVLDLIEPYNNQNFITDDANKLVLTLAECTSLSYTNINFQTRVCSKTALGDCSESNFAQFTNGSITYCLNRHYCTNSTRGLSLYWNVASSACAASCTGSLPKEDINDDKQCVSEHKCSELNYFIEMEAGSTAMEAKKCIPTCASYPYSKPSFNTTFVTRKECLKTCEKDYALNNTSCIPKVDCIFNSSGVCQNSVHDTLNGATVFEYSPSTGFNTINNCSASGLFKYANYPNTCLTLDQCKNMGFVVISGSFSSINYSCDYYCNKAHQIKLNGVTYCTDSCVVEFTDFGGNGASVRYHLQIEENLKEHCVSRDSCLTPKYILEGTTCLDRKLCNMGSNRRLVIDSATSEKCQSNVSCDCRTLNCNYLPGPKDICYSRTYCAESSEHALFLSESGYITCVESTNESPLISTKDACLQLEIEGEKSYFFNEGEKTDCLTKAQCTEKGLYTTADRRCVSGTQCQSDSMFLTRVGGENVCMTEQNCKDKNYSVHSNNHLYANSPPVCLNCTDTQVYIGVNYAAQNKLDNCQASCPTGQLVDRETMSCSATCRFFSNQAKTECLNACPSAYVQIDNTDNDVCLDNFSCPDGLLTVPSKSWYKYYGYNTCVRGCPVDFKPISGNKCLYCVDFLYEEKCISQCPTFTEPNSVLGTCTDCTKNTDGLIAFYEGRCQTLEAVLKNRVFLFEPKFNGYVKCGVNNETAFDEASNKCFRYCPSENQGRFEGLCKTCSPGSNGLYTCRVEEGVFYETANCSTGYVKHPEKPYLCITANQAVNINQTVCKPTEIINPDGFCQACREASGWFEYDSGCVTRCPEGTLENFTNGNVCQKCTLTENNACVLACSTGFTNNQGICTPCVSDNAAITKEVINGRCETICPAPAGEACFTKPQAVQGGACQFNCKTCVNGTAITFGTGSRCSCPAEFSGEFCENTAAAGKEKLIKAADNVESTLASIVPEDSSNQLLTNNKKLSIIRDMDTMFNNLSGNVADLESEAKITTVINSLERISKSTVQYFKNNKNGNLNAKIGETITSFRQLLDHALTKVADKLYLDSLNTASSRTLNQVGLSSITLTQLKSAIKTTIDYKIGVTDFSGKPVLEEYAYYKVFYYLSNTNDGKIQENKDEAQNRNVPFIDTSDCLTAKSESSLKIALLEWNLPGRQPTETSQVEFLSYNSTDNLVSCSAGNYSVTFRVASLPAIAANSATLTSYISEGIDIMNPEDKFYRDRCFSYSRDDKDYTLNMRRKYLFPQQRAGCSSNCVYSSMDQSFGLTCSCTNTAMTKAVTVSSQLESIFYRSYLFEMFECNSGISNDQADKAANAALWSFIGLFIIVAIIAVIFGFYQIVGKAIKDKYESVRQSSQINKFSKKTNMDIKLNRAVEAEVDGDRVGMQEGQNLSNSNINSNINAQNEEKVALQHTLADFDNMPVEDAVKLDDRGFGSYFTYIHLKNNLLFAPFLTDSLLKDNYVRLIELTLLLSGIMFFNSLFLFDEAVENYYDQNDTGDAVKVFTTFRGGFDRVFYSIIMVYVVKGLFHILVYPTQASISKLNEGFEGKGADLKAKFSEFTRMNMLKYAIGLVLAFVYLFVGFWYSLAVIDFHQNMDIDWFMGCIWTLLFYWASLFVFHVIHALLRSLAKGSAFFKVLFAFSRTLVN